MPVGGLAGITDQPVGLGVAGLFVVADPAHGLGASGGHGELEVFFDLLSLSLGLFLVASRLFGRGDLDVLAGRAGPCHDVRRFEVCPLELTPCPLLDRVRRQWLPIKPVELLLQLLVGQSAHLEECGQVVRPGHGGVAVRGEHTEFEVDVVVDLTAVVSAPDHVEAASWRNGVGGLVRIGELVRHR
jgi:hypothetical protein